MKAEPRHYCIAGDCQRYLNIVRNDSNEELLNKLNTWGEFHMPLSKNAKPWRVFCGIARREAARRGLPTALKAGA